MPNCVYQLCYGGTLSLYPSLQSFAGWWNASIFLIAVVANFCISATTHYQLSSVSFAIDITCNAMPFIQHVNGMLKITSYWSARPTLMYDDVILWNIFRVTGFFAGNSSVTGVFFSQRPLTHSFNVFFDLRLNKRLNKQTTHRLFETPSRSL